MKVITFGRQQDNVVVIRDHTVSRHHMQITQHDDGHITLSGLQTVNGTYINGKRVEGIVELHYGDIVKIGNTTLNWEDYFLADALKDLSKEPSELPPFENAMCYCRPPEDWDGNNYDPWNPPSLTINDSRTPLVVLFGPRGCGKTMTLIRLTRYVESMGYSVTPDRFLRPINDLYYQKQCDDFKENCYSCYAPNSIPFMLLKVSDKIGHPICQILKLPGDLCFDPISHRDTVGSPILTHIMHLPNSRTWVFIVEQDWEYIETREAYVARLQHLSAHVRRDKIIFSCHKIDKHPELMFAKDKPNTQQILKKIRCQYQGIFDNCKNSKPILRLFTFIPFSAGEFMRTEDGRQCYIYGDDIYPQRLWKAITKANNRLGCRETIIICLISFVIALMLWLLAAWLVH